MRKTHNLALDLADEDLSGDAILSGTARADSHVPEVWTAEYAELRMVDAFAILRRTAGRVGPRSHANAWPEYMHEFEDIREWADQHRNEVWSAMEASRVRATSEEIAKMEEALIWPARYLSDQPLLADTVVLFGFFRGFGIQPSQALKGRLRKAKRAAVGAADHENAIRRQRRSVLLSEAKKMMAKLLRDWKVDQRSPEGQRQAIEKARHQTMLRYGPKVKAAQPVKPRPTLAMPDKILSESQLHRKRKQAFQALADRLHENGVEIR